MIKYIIMRYYAFVSLFRPLSQTSSSSVWESAECVANISYAIRLQKSRVVWGRKRSSDNSFLYNSLPTNGMNNRLYIYFARDEHKY